MRKRIICICVLMVIMGAALGYGQNSPAVLTTGTIKGSIAEIDWVAGKIIVRTFDFDDNADTITFFVTDDTEITKGTNTIYLSDLHQADQVRVTYFSAANSFAGLQATEIKVIQ